MGILYFPAILAIYAAYVALRRLLEENLGKGCRSLAAVRSDRRD